MRLVTLIVVLSLGCCVAEATAISAKSRARWRSMQLVSKRLNEAVKELEGELDDVAESLYICGLHTKPIVIEHGGFEPDEKSVVVGSEQELELIMQQHGYAGTAANWADIRKGMWTSTGWRFGRWARGAMWACLPWAMCFGLLWFFFYKRGRIVMDQKEEQKATFAAIQREYPNKSDRVAKFADPLIDRAYQREVKKPNK